MIDAKRTIAAKEITEHINIDLKASYYIETIRNILKNILELSFKQVKYQSNNVDLDKLNSIRNFFAIRF